MIDKWNYQIQKVDVTEKEKLELSVSVLAKTKTMANNTLERQPDKRLEKI